MELKDYNTDNGVNKIVVVTMKSGITYLTNLIKTGPDNWSTLVGFRIYEGDREIDENNIPSLFMFQSVDIEDIQVRPIDIADSIFSEYGINKSEWIKVFDIK